jgi:lipopolysaccharide/colanic/teichoic acid biosynthesis glycosyltransferase
MPIAASEEVLEPASSAAGEGDIPSMGAIPEPSPRLKRILDVMLVLAALPFVLPVALVLCVFIKIVSPGPALFRQRRVGLGGGHFSCLKFRTMKLNADTKVHQAHLKELMASNRPTRKLDYAGDKRLIPGAMWLRALCVDELPQLINVLRGDMSLVGPRPCTPSEFGLFSERHKQRCLAMPGLTGLWQISGKNKTTFEQMMDLDLKYVREKSLWMDLKIIAGTVPAIIKLAWEIKVLPRLAAWRAGSATKADSGYHAKTAGRLPGTVPAQH